MFDDIAQRNVTRTYVRNLYDVVWMWGRRQSRDTLTCHIWFYCLPIVYVRKLRLCYVCGKYVLAETHTYVAIIVVGIGSCVQKVYVSRFMCLPHFRQIKYSCLCMSPAYVCPLRVPAQFMAKQVRILTYVFIYASCVCVLCAVCALRATHASCHSLGLHI